MRLLFLPLLFGCLVSACFGQVGKFETPASVSSDSRDSISRFEELATRYKALQEQFYEHEPNEDEDGLKRFIEYDPMNTMVNDFLTLEQHARGTQVGFSCLYHLVLAAGSVADAEYPVTQGKIAALKILGQYYHEYPDINTTFRYLFAGARVPASKATLRELIASSRLDSVRANAMYELANYLALEANLPAMCVSRQSGCRDVLIQGLWSLRGDVP